MAEITPVTRELLVTDIIDQAALIPDRGVSAQALLTAAQNWPHSVADPDWANLNQLIEACHSHAMQAEEQAIQSSLNVMSQLARLLNDDALAV